MIPQVILTLSPSGDIIAELPGPSGLRRHVPINSLESVRRILASQLSAGPQSIGTNSAPTTGQSLHWSEHLDAGKTDPNCPWCIAAELGIDTSRAAYRRARATLAASSRTRAKPANVSFAGDGTVRVRHLNKKGKEIPHIDMAGLLE